MPVQDTFSAEQTQAFLDELSQVIVGKDSPVDLTTQHPIVNVRVNGVDILNSDERPSFLREFTYTSKFGAVYDAEVLVVDPFVIGGVFNLVRLDEVFFLASAEAENDPDGNVVFSFGYPNELPPKESPTRRARLMTVQPSFVDAGMEFRLGFMGLGAESGVRIADSTAPVQDESEVKFAGVDREYAGNIGEVVTQIAGHMGLDADVVATDDSRIAPDSKDTKVWPLNNAPALEFIKNELQPQARSVNGQAGYVVWITENRSTPPGKLGTLHFRPPFSPDPPRRVFVTGVQSQGDVISFTFDLDSTIGAFGTSIVTRGVDKTTKQYGRNARGVGNQAELATTGSKTHLVATGIDSIMFTRFVHGDAAERESRALWEFLFNMISSAELAVKGDPSTLDLEAGDIVRVINTLPGGKIHFSSGDWVITEAVHSIVDAYEVTMQLMRNLMSSGGGLNDMSGQGSQANK